VLFVANKYTIIHVIILSRVSPDALSKLLLFIYYRL